MALPISSPRHRPAIAPLRLVEDPSAGSSLSVVPGSATLPEWASSYRRRLIATDTAVIVLSVTGAFAARFWWGATPLQFGEIVAHYLVITAVIMTSWLVALTVYRSREQRLMGAGVAEYRRVAAASFVAFGLLAIAFQILEIDVARGFFVLALPLGVLALLAGRWSWRNWLNRRRSHGDYRSRTLVVGERADVEFVTRQMERQPNSAYEIVGAAIDGDMQSPVSLASRSIPVVSSHADVARAAARMNVDAVIVAGHPSGGSHYIRDLGWDLEGTAAELIVASRLTNVAGPRIHFRPVEGLPLMHVELPQYEGGKHVLKRALDVVGSAAGLVLLLPLMVVIAVLVRLDSDGPVLFRQERVGRGGAAFSILKFRSMVSTAEDDLAGLLDQNQGAGVLFKMQNDPRVTRIGRVLRRYSLDELPQLWNVLIGDMSLVGPRPPLRREVADYESRVHRRLYIKPGITGMWQVNGRSTLDWDESVRLDLYYVENWSITGDLVILWRTLRVLRQSVGAW
ncbi:sugar transferase [Marisediminicola senii]|uniref:sugar transferase n=1 Tax=Marisediminicola senii TaxID=2711233 RepID=UPI0013EA572E|nr:sugar transferase [Marisediminicola senii]